MTKNIRDSYKRLKTLQGKEQRYGGFDLANYEEQGITRNIIEIPVNDALMKGIESPTPIVVKEWERLRGAIRKALILLREDGAIAIIPKVQKIISHRNCNPSSFDVNPLSDTYLQPYTLNIQGVEGRDINREDFIYMMLGGTEEYQELNYKGLSLLEQLKDPIERYIKGLSVSTDILDTLNQDVILFSDLHEKLENSEEQDILDRLEVIARLKSNHSIVALDKEDEYVTVNKTLSGAKDVTYYNALDVCAVAKTPYSRIFGKGVGGIANNSEPELKLYYDTVVSSLQHIASDIFNHLTMNEYKDKFSFPELYTKDIKEIADTLKTNTDTVVILQEHELIDEEEAKQILGVGKE